jgi:hypothetical protein
MITTTVEHPEGTKLVPFEGGWKVETILETGRWYKSGKCLCFYKSGEEQYGFHGVYGDWVDNAYWMTNLGNAPTQWTLASEEEVKEALIKEAEHRGYREHIEFINARYNTLEYADNGTIEYYKADNVLFLASSTIFFEGRWAEIISNPNEKILKRIATIEKELEQLKAELK